MAGRPHILCGVVEGFYGRPWSMEQRKLLFQWLSRWGLNCYMYAPKDELKHRLLWREPYTEHEAACMQSLIKAAQEQGVEFVFAISAGQDMVFSSAGDRLLLQQKLRQVAAMGCHSFALLFDDIDPYMCQADRNVFPSLAKAQASVANEVYQQLGQPSIFLFCPTEYCSSLCTPSPSRSCYLLTIGQELLPGIGVIWTGPKVVSQELSATLLEEVEGVLQRRPVIWDNLYANDYDCRRVFLGPYTGRAAGLMPRLHGLLLNPNWAETAAVLGDSHDPREGSYSPQEALELALCDWVAEIHRQAMEPGGRTPGHPSVNLKGGVRLQPGMAGGQEIMPEPQPHDSVPSGKDQNGPESCSLAPGEGKRMVTSEPEKGSGSRTTTGGRQSPTGDRDQLTTGSRASCESSSALPSTAGSAQSAGTWMPTETFHSPGATMCSSNGANKSQNLPLCSGDARTEDGSCPQPEASRDDMLQMPPGPGADANPAPSPPLIDGAGTSPEPSAPPTDGAGTNPVSSAPPTDGAGTNPNPSALPSDGAGTSTVSPAPLADGAGTNPDPSAPPIAGAGNNPLPTAPLTDGPQTNPDPPALLTDGAGNSPFSLALFNNEVGAIPGPMAPLTPEEAVSSSMSLLTVEKAGSGPMVPLTPEEARTSPTASVIPEEARTSPTASVTPEEARTSPTASVTPEEARTSPTASVTPEEARSSPTASVTPEEARSSATASVTPEEARSSATASVIPEEARTSPTASVIPEEARTSATASVIPEEARSSPTASVTPEEARSSPTASVTPEEARTSPTAQVTPEEARTSPTAQVTPEEARTSPTASVIPEEARSSATASVIPEEARTSPTASVIPEEARTSPTAPLTPEEARTSPTASVIPEEARTSTTAPLAPEEARSSSTALLTPEEARSSPTALLTPEEARSSPTAQVTLEEARSSPTAPLTPEEARTSPTAPLTPEEARSSPTALLTPEEARTSPTAQVTLEEARTSPKAQVTLEEARTSPTAPLTPEEARTSPTAPLTPEEAKTSPTAPLTPEEARTSPTAPLTPEEARSSPTALLTPEEARTSPTAPLTPEEARSSPTAQVTPEEARTSPTAPLTPEEARSSPTAPLTPEEARSSPTAPLTPEEARSSPTAPLTPEEAGCTPMAPLTLGEVRMLVELFYLPYHHGPLAQHLLEHFRWLRANSLSVGVPATASDACGGTQWRGRAQSFQLLCAQTCRLHSHFVSSAGRALLYDLHPYLWDIRNMLLAASAFVLWLDGHLLCDPDPKGTWGSCFGWCQNITAPILLGSDAEPWARRGGLCGELQALLPVGNSCDLFYHPPPLFPSSQLYVLRPLLPLDKGELYRMCRESLDCDPKVAEILASHPDLLGDRLLGSFLSLSPEYTFVLEDEDGPCGYAAGALCAEGFLQQRDSSWLPALRHKYPRDLDAAPSALGQDVLEEALLFFHAEPPTVPLPVLRRFPSLVQLGTAPRVLDVGASRSLAICLLSALRANGSRGVFCQVSDADRQQLSFYSKLGFVALPVAWGSSPGARLLGRLL
ncbi:protein O-GlcNAcase-like isoform X2 [Melanerpes formicivorus]|uniref:protein O-GlcNAcase-like isoform X2 n=1 Tax=Melanerpes formicivorus TaxID=211600 RepID=UPI00358DD9A5